ncbi:MAG TPA: hypothetical protein VIW24_31555 [Aldersonia sp.]
MLEYSVHLPDDGFPDPRTAQEVKQFMRGLATGLRGGGPDPGSGPFAGEHIGRTIDESTPDSSTGRAPYVDNSTRKLDGPNQRQEPDAGRELS